MSHAAGHPIPLNEAPRLHRGAEAPVLFPVSAPPERASTGRTLLRLPQGPTTQVPRDTAGRPISTESIPSGEQRVTQQCEVMMYALQITPFLRPITARAMLGHESSLAKPILCDFRRMCRRCASHYPSPRAHAATLA